MLKRVKRIKERQDNLITCVIKMLPSVLGFREEALNCF